MTKVKEEKKRQTRMKFLEAAEQLFAQHGFAATTVEQITQAAGFSKGTIYCYFKSKEELFISLLVEKFDRFFSGIEKLLSEKLPVRELMIAVAEYHISFYFGNTHFFQIILSEHYRGVGGHPGPLGKRIFEGYRHYVELLSEVIDSDPSIFRTSLPSQQIAVFFITTVNGLVGQHFFTKEKQGKPLETARLAFELFANGALADKGEI